MNSTLIIFRPLVTFPSVSFGGKIGSIDQHSNLVELVTTNSSDIISLAHVPKVLFQYNPSYALRLFYIVRKLPVL